MAKIPSYAPARSTKSKGGSSTKTHKGGFKPITKKEFESGSPKAKASVIKSMDRLLREKSREKFPGPKSKYMQPLKGKK